MTSRSRLHTMGLAEQLSELFGNRAAKLLGIDDGDRAAIIARDVMPDADRDQLDRRAGLDLLDDVTQVAFEILPGLTESVESSTGAPSEIIIRILRCSE